MQNLDNIKTYQQVELRCNCGCVSHCGHSCMTEDCDCNECLCPGCKEQDVSQA